MISLVRKAVLFLFIVFFTYNNLLSQQATLHGYVRDQSNGEALIGTNVYAKGTTKGVITNYYGFYSLTLSPGKYTIVFTYVGYEEVEKEVDLDADMSLHIELSPRAEAIEEVVISAEGENQNISSSRMSVQILDGKTIEKIPVIFGEADVIKSLKLLPGVVATSEISSNLSIRGGARDQNMLLLDEATVYNASHLLGLFSVFNNDAIKHVELYKGIMPARYGGRISSLIDIRMKEGNMKETSGVGSIGLLTSRFTIEAPVVKDKGAILLSGRRTYLDLLYKGLKKLSPDKVKGDVPLYFYDFNAKANFIFNDNNRLYLSGYFGRDVYRMEVGEQGKMNNEWGNYTGTLRWNHVFNKRLFSNTTLLVSNYDYTVEIETKYGEEEKILSVDWEAFLKDYGIKADFGYFLNPDNTVRFGISSTYHDFNVGKVESQSDTLRFDFQIPKYYCLEWVAYLGNEQKAGNFTLDYGIRASMIQNVGPATVYDLEKYKVTDTTIYKKGNTYNSYLGLEPRLSIAYVINQRQSVKVGYARTRQYLHVASNSESGTPLDVWMPVGPNVNPQVADQVAAGYFRNFLNNKIKTSLEVYYKYMQNQLEFRENTELFFNDQIEEEFRFGIGRAYGIETMAYVPSGRFIGWVSYTLSRSERKIKDIQEKGWYLSPFDITHNIALVGTYDITRRFNVSANWIYLTGRPFSAPVARWEFGGEILPYYGGRNKSRYPAHHRLDVGFEIKNKPHENYVGSWSFSIYNLYNRRNANVIYFDESDTGPYHTSAYRISLLQRIYSVAFNFKF